MERLTIGKTPVREAMRCLVLEGLLDVTPRLGYAVAGISLDHVMELFDLLTIVEVAAAQASAENLDDLRLQRLNALGDIGYDPDDDDSMVRFTESNAEFHTTIAQGSGNRRLADLIALLMTECCRFAQNANLSVSTGRQSGSSTRRPCAPCALATGIASPMPLPRTCDTARRSCSTACLE